jgi:acylphosphatase
MSDELTTFRLRLRGLVQGVGFREWAIEEAKSRKLDGWVRNRRDDTVEMVISGADASVQDMLRVCTQGPPSARVEKIDITREDELPAAGFRRHPTL